MKLIIPFLIATIALVGCGKETVVTEITPSETRFNGINAEYINIITDSETGCKYIFVVDGAGTYRTTAMSPLYKASGVVDCN